MNTGRYGGTLRDFMRQAAAAYIPLPRIGETVEMDGKTYRVESEVMDEITLVPIDREAP